MPAPARPVLRLAEADYQYGVGDLYLRIEQVDVAHPISYDGETWYPVEGTQVTRSGAEIGRRSVVVRARRLGADPGH